MSGTGPAKSGVYICRGCGIGEALDTAALAEAAAGGAGVGVVRTSDAFCLEDAASISADIEAEGLSAVVVAACSPREKTGVFRFPVTTRRVNLREQAAWCSEPSSPEAASLASDLLAMGIASARYSEPPSPYLADHEQRVLVVGGGPAGLAAASAAADAGFEVVLAEREEQLGGFWRRLGGDFPSPWGGVPQGGGPGELAEALALRPAVSLLTSTTVSSISGQPGRFVASLEGPGGATEEVIGSVVMATGFETPPPERFARLGLGSAPDVITSVDLESMVASGKIARPSDGAPPRRVAILACDGPQDSGNAGHLGVVGSKVALKQAGYVLSHLPGSQAFLVYEDLETTGVSELYYRDLQTQPDVFFVRGRPTSVSQSTSGRLEVSVDATVLAREVSLAVDLVVLQVGMVPTTSPQLSEPVSLHLGYLQGEALPTHRGGFVDSNFVCFPFETRRSGIYAAGSVHRLGSVADVMTDGAAAALKAVQVVHKAASGAAVHPRVGDLGYPRFFMQKCTACGRCTQECPFGALELDSQRHPVVNPNRCRRCGICMGACPVQVISFPDYSVEMLSEMQKSLDLPEDDPNPKILLLACENDAYPALDMVGLNRLRYPSNFRVVPVRCLGSVNAIVVGDAIQRGYDAVVLAGCRSGEDYQCHFIEGSGLLGKRMANVAETLGRMAIEEERVQVIETSIADAHRLPGVLSALAEQMAELGPNPMKGF